MIKKRLCLFILIILCLGFGALKAQNTNNTVLPLSKILELIETKYNVSFSYVDKSIDGISIKAPEDSLTLKEVVDYLKDKTDLDFTLLNDRFIVIRARSDDDDVFDIQSLEEVVITNYLTSGISKTITNTVTIEPEKFGILPGLIEPDVLQTIQALPGIISVDELASDINIRGGTNDENLILWDGIKMYQSGHFFGMISAFNPYLTDKINVAKNGTSVYYGDGVSGVIDMRNKDHIDGEFEAGLGVNLLNADGYIKMPISDKTELQVSARKSITDFVNTPTYNQYFERIFEGSNFNNNNAILSNSERFNFNDTSIKLLYDISKSDQLRVNFISIFNDLKYEEESVENTIVQSSDSELKQVSLAFGAKYSKYWNKDLRTSLQIYYSTYDLEGTNIDLISNQRLTQENRVEDLGVRFNLTRSLDERLNLSAGYQFNEVGVSNLEVVNMPNFRSFSKDFNRTHAIYGEAEFTSKNRATYARIGLRTNFIESFSLFYTEPRLAFSQKLNDQWRLEILGEFKSQSITQVIDLQQDFLGIEKRRWLQSNNDDIPLIESQQASIGLHYNKNKLLISVEPFTKTVNGISTRSQGFQNQFQFVTASGKYQASGIDVLINKQFESFSTWLSYSYSKNDYEFEDLNDNIPFPNNKDIRHAATFAGVYDYENLKLAFGFNWHTGKPATTPSIANPNTGNIINYDMPNNDRLQDYFRVDMSATYSFKMSQKTDAVVGLSVWNILDRENIINRYYAVDNNDDVVAVENQALGFTPNFNFRVRF